MLLPFGTNMSNSNVMAIPENEDYTDQYMRYTMDIVNDYEDGSSYSNDGGYDSEDHHMLMSINTNLKIEIVVVSA